MNDLRITQTRKPSAAIRPAWTVYPIKAFDQFKDAWRDLQLRSNGSLLLDADIVGLLLSEFAQGNETLAVCNADGYPTAICVLARSGFVRWQTWQPSQAPLGLWIQDSRVDFRALAATLQAKLSRLSLLLALTQQDPDLRARPQTTKRVRTLNYINTGRIMVKDSFSDYWSGRGKNLRTNLRKLRTRLEKSGDSSRLEVLTMAGDIVQAVADYGRLESTGWKGRDGTAVASSNAQGRFYCDLLELSCKRNEGLVYRYWLGDRLVASDLCIHRQGVLFMLKTAYDETQAKWSPAMLMHEAILKDIFDNSRFNVIEFYGRTKDWHLRLTDDIRTMYHINFYRWACIPQLLAMRARFRQPLRSTLES